MSNLGTTMPVYVTRKTAGGTTGQLSISIWLALLILLFVLLNAILWGAYGVFEVVRLWVHA